MECEVKVCRAAAEGKYHATTVTLDNNGESIALICSMSQCFNPVKVAVNKDTVKRIIDVRAEAGLATIILSEYQTNGIREIFIKNANPVRLRELIHQMKSVLPMNAASPSPRNRKT